jgi:paraquat-inducible protein B
MAAPTNHWKLGLFVVVGAVLGLATIVFLGAQGMRQEVVKHRTFFDESVQGLEVGSPVKFRGVTIGHVAAIDVAADRRHVGVTSELIVKDLADLGLSEGTGAGARIRIPEDLRAQLASQGITGVKFIQIDFFNLHDNPRPQLPFAEPAHYIPAAVSTMKNLEDAIVRAVDRIPELAENILKVTTQIGRLLDETESKHIPESTSTALAGITQVLTSLEKAVKDVNTGKLSQQAQQTIERLNGTISRANGILGRLDGDKGLLASAQRASGAVGDVATGARGVGQELEETLRDIQEVTAAIQRVADALERDPDMLLKGRSKTQ